LLKSSFIAKILKKSLLPSHITFPQPPLGQEEGEYPARGSISSSRAEDGPWKELRARKVPVAGKSRLLDITQMSSGGGVRENNL